MTPAAGDVAPKSQRSTKEDSEAGAIKRPKRTIDEMKKLFAKKVDSIDDKIATVKTAQRVDKGRFETAFKTLMKK